MSTLTKEALLDLIRQAVMASGWSVRVLGDDHPFRLDVHKGDAVERLRIYIWNITHGGGRARPADEYRIQLTGVPRIDVTPPLKTLLLGWDERYRVFVGYNASRYTTFGASPSLQVKEGTMQRANSEGFGIQPKEWDDLGEVTEVVVAFRPELFMAYASSLNTYHRPSLTRGEVTLIQTATSRPLTDDELNILPAERRTAIRQHDEAIRDAKFRKAVLQVYHDKCAICGLQLGLVEAAHIVPVPDGGTDEVTNGVALCPNHHDAFDDGLFVITEKYKVLPANEKLRMLQGDGKAGNIKEFLAGLRGGESISLPDNPRYHPNPEYLKRRMRLEGFSFTL